MSQGFDQATGRKRYFELMDEAVSGLMDPDTGKVRLEMLEQVPCPLCEESKEFEFLFAKQGFDFVRCQSCGLVFVNPQLRSELIDSLYADETTFYTAWTQVLLNPNNQAWQVPYFEENIAILKPYVGSGDLLDVGCSIGLFMQLAERDGYRCIGLELERAAYEYARAQGLDVRRHTLTDAKFAPETFDVVTMFGVLEHLKQPKLVLGDVWHCLRPGGAVMAIVPNVYSLAAMTLHGQAQMFNGRNHLSYFSLRTLQSIFEQCGFVIQHQDTCLTALDSILSYLQFNSPHSALKLDYLPSRLRQFLETPADRKRAELLIQRLDLGLRARVVAIKPR